MSTVGPQDSSDVRVQASYDVYLQALLAGNRTAALNIVQQLIGANVPLKAIYIGLFERSLYQVGDLWESDRISVGVEHMATAITESAMALLYPLLFTSPRRGHRAVVSCVADEFHQVGARMVADTFELNGWDGYFLGANVPGEALLAMLEEKKPDFLCLSLTVRHNLPTMLHGIELVRASFPQQEILLGGQALKGGGREAAEDFPAVTYVESIDRLEDIIRERR
jgi:MerR family transcriptional regulator, light-induced transcriptional regulator